jgi:hypothetical protein
MAVASGTVNSISVPKNPVAVSRLRYVTSSFSASNPDGFAAGFATYLNLVQARNASRARPGRRFDGPAHI